MAAPNYFPTPPKRIDPRSRRLYMSVAVVGDKFVCLFPNCTANHFHYKASNSWECTRRLLLHHQKLYHRRRTFDEKFLQVYFKLSSEWVVVEGELWKVWQQKRSERRRSNRPEEDFPTFATRRLNWFHHLLIPRADHLQNDQINEFISFIGSNVTRYNIIQLNRGAFPHCFQPQFSNRILGLIEVWREISDILSIDQCASFMAQWICYIIQNMEQQIDGFEKKFEEWIQNSCEGSIWKKRVFTQSLVFLIPNVSINLQLHEVLFKQLALNLAYDMDDRVRQAARQYLARFRIREQTGN